MRFKVRQCSRIPQKDEGSEEGFVEFVVASGDASEVFELVDEPLDAIALAVKSLVEGRFLENLK